MNFKEILEGLPAIEHLQGIDIKNGELIIHHIPAIEGKMGSLKVYNALLQEFAGKLDVISAKKGLLLFAEHTEDARKNLGKHPNIDLLFQVIDNQSTYTIIPVTMSEVD